MKMIFLAAGSMMLSSVLMAAPLQVAPKAGQWVVTTQSQIEGRDLAPHIQRIKQQAAAFLNTEQQKKLAQYDPSQFAMCLKPTQAELLTDPKKTVDAMAKSLGQCQLQLDGQTATAVHFSGYCNASTYGVAGQVQGQINYTSSTTAQGHITGVGTLPPAVQLLVLGKVQPQVQVRNTFSAQWQQQACSAQ